MQPEISRPRVLVLSFGEAQADLAAALGVRTAINVRDGLSDHAERMHRGCTGDSGHLMLPAVDKPAFPGFLRDAAQAILADCARQGGAVVGFQCRAGKHRSALMAAMLHHYLSTHGFVVELRHLGGWQTMGCRCSEGPFLPFCPEVAKRSSVPEARADYQVQLQKRQQAFDAAVRVLQAMLG